MKDWYEGMTNGQRILVYLVSVVLIYAYGIGLLALSMLIYLHLGRTTD